MQVGVKERYDTFIANMVACGNGAQAVRETPGYENKWARQTAAHLLSIPYIKQGIAEKTAKLVQIIEHNYEKALEMLTTRLGWLDKAAKMGNVQAIQAQTAIIREMDEITGLRKQAAVATTVVVPVLTEVERAASEAAARVYKLRILNSA